MTPNYRLGVWGWLDLSGEKGFEEEKYLTSGSNGMMVSLLAEGLFDRVLLSSATQAIRTRETAQAICRQFLACAGFSTCHFGLVADGVVIPFDWQERLHEGREVLIAAYRDFIMKGKVSWQPYTQENPVIYRIDKVLREEILQEADAFMDFPQESLRLRKIIY